VHLPKRDLGNHRTNDDAAEHRSGRPRTLPADVVERIRAARAQGGSWSAIARDLHADAAPTAQGGSKWYPATVRYVHESRTVAVG
jgi:hypothetical protein